MRAQRYFGNPFNNRGQFWPGRGRGFQGWRGPIHASSTENTQTNETTESFGMKYVGPCRCGRGPHAFYRSTKGDLVHVSEIKGSEQ